MTDREYVPITKYTISEVRNVIVRLKREAMKAGRYEFTSAGFYDKRDKSKAFRCITYNTRVRQINALTRLLRKCGQDCSAHSAPTRDV